MKGVGRWRQKLEKVGQTVGEVGRRSLLFLCHTDVKVSHVVGLTHCCHGVTCCKGGTQASALFSRLHVPGLPVSSLIYTLPHLGIYASGFCKYLQLFFVYPSLTFRAYIRTCNTNTGLTAMLSASLIALCAFLAIAAVYSFLAIGQSRSRIYDGITLALLIAIAGLTGYAFLSHLETSLALAARV